jgi:two-component system, OmpR family, KDP operon response regulator KdpE
MYTTAQVSTGEILVLCASPDHWVMQQLGGQYNLFQLDDFKAVVNSLTSIQYELLILDDRLLDTSIHSVISDVRRQFHMLPIIVYTDRSDIDYHELLAAAGANGTISPTMEPQQLHLQIQLMLAQHSRDRALIAYTRKLHSITYLPRLLDNATDPQTVIAQLVRLLGSLLNTCGVAVVLKEGSGLRLYAGATDINSIGTLHQANYHPQKRDPFLWTLTSGHSQIYQDISVNAHYSPLPGFPKHLSAAIVPLIFQNDTIGALGIFNHADTPVKHEDLVIYDQIAFQLATFLRYASMYENKHMMNQANTSLLEAWDTLAGLRTANEVINALCDLIKSLLPISSVMVWLTSQGDSDTIIEFWTNPEIDADNSGEAIERHALTRELEQMVDPDQTTVAAARNVEKDTQLSQLMTSLNVKQLLVRPMTMGNQIVGGIFITISDSETVNWSERYIFDNLARIGESVAERTVLNEAVHYSHTLVTAILASISEGIFFIDNNNKLAYLTPQVQELTRIDSPITIGSDSQFVLQAIADKTSDPAPAFTKLWSAAMAANDMRGDTYAFTSASLSPYELDIDIEFLPVGRNAKESTGWLGIVRNSARTKRADLFKGLLSKLRAPFTQVRNLVASLAEEHGQLSYGERDQMLRDIYGVVENAGQKWEVLSDVFNLQFDTMEMNRDFIKVQDLMHRIINSHAFSASQWRINIVNETPLARVALDEFYAKRAITYLLRRALSLLPDQNPLNIRIEQNTREVSIAFEDNFTSFTDEQIARFSDPSLQIADISPNDLSLFIAKELIRKNSGRMTIENNAAHKTVITVIFPAVAVEEADEKAAMPAIAKPRIVDQAAMIGRPAPVRSFRSVMLVQGESAMTKRLRQLMEKQELDLLVYESAEEAFIDLNSTLLDLIVIDGRLREGSGVEICQKMRRSTEVPIILVYDNATATERIEGLNRGADEIVSEPISDEELMARVRAITKRQQIADRISEPLIINDLQIDLSRREVFVAGQPVELTRIEYDLLNTMIMNRNQVLTHKQLLTKVWGPEYLDETQYLWVNISRLRKKLEPTPNSTRYIRTQPGVGYYFAADKR